MDPVSLKFGAGCRASGARFGPCLDGALIAEQTGRTHLRTRLGWDVRPFEDRLNLLRSRDGSYFSALKHLLKDLLDDALADDGCDPVDGQGPIPDLLVTVRACSRVSAGDLWHHDCYVARDGPRSESHHW